MANLSLDIQQLDHFITLDQAIDMTKRFRDLKDKILNPVYIGKNILPLCETFNKDAIAAVINQPGAVGFRSYLGMNENLEVSVIFVGVNDKNEDMLPQVLPMKSMSMTADDPTGGTDPIPDDEPPIVEEGQRCPTDCPASSPLNTP
jgi:hypothetical protein